MAANVNATGFESANQSAVSAFVGVFSGFATKTVGALAALTKNMQHARMLSALNSLSDYQLDQVGIKRSDIPAYAKNLLAYEKD